MAIMRDIMRGIMRDIMRGAMAGLGGIARIFYAPLTSSLIPITAVDKTYTFTRNDTDATVTDFEGLVKDVTANEARFVGARRVENLFAKSEDFTDASWLLFKSMVKDGVTTIDDVTAMELTTGTASDSALYQTNVISLTTGRYVIRAKVRAKTGSVTIRLAPGAVEANPQDFSPDITIGTTWTDIAFITTSNLGSAGNSSVRNGSGGGVQTFYLANIQIEEVIGQGNTNPSEYVSNGENEDHGSNADGVKYFSYENGNTVASNVVTEAQGATIAAATLKGVLVEEARTNNCIWSEDLSNAAWVASNITKSSDGIQLPNGRTGTAETLTASGGNGTLLQTITLAAAVNNFSVYLQRKTGTGNIDITLDNGATWTTKALTGAGTWDRVNVQGVSAANPIVGIRIVTNGDAVQMWGAQLETGAFLTSHIPTVGATATRNAEALSYPNTNILDAEGTVGLSFTPNGSTAQYVSSAVDRALVGVRGTNIDLLYIDDTSGETALADGTNVTTITAMPSLVANTTVKLAGRWSAITSLMAIGQDGTTDEVAFDGSMNKSTAVRIGYSGANRASGSHKNLSIYDGSVDDTTFVGLHT